MKDFPCCCDNDGNQLSLVHVHVPPNPRTRGKKTGVHWAKYRPKTRQLCDQCIADIHSLGAAIAPHPQPVRWRRTDVDGPRLLCERHKNEQLEKDLP